jgi:hypothetical protein
MACGFVPKWRLFHRSNLSELRQHGGIFKDARVRVAGAGERDGANKLTGEILGHGHSRFGALTLDRLTGCKFSKHFVALLDLPGEWQGDVIGDRGHPLPPLTSAPSSDSCRLDLR